MGQSRNKGSNTGKRARRKNLRHPRERFLVSNEAPPIWRPIEIFSALSTADLRNYWTEFRETWWSYRYYMFLVGPKVFSFVVKGVKVIFEGFKGGGGYYRILWERYI